MRDIRMEDATEDAVDPVLAAAIAEVDRKPDVDALTPPKITLRRLAPSRSLWPLSRLGSRRPTGG
jgi:hypothetical protein